MNKKRINNIDYFRKSNQKAADGKIAVAWTNGSRFA